MIRSVNPSNLVNVNEENFVEVGFMNYFQGFSLEDDNNSLGMCMIFKKLHEINLKLAENWGSEKMNRAILDIENEILPSTYY